MFYCNYSQVTA